MKASMCIGSFAIAGLAASAASSRIEDTLDDFEESIGEVVENLKNVKKEEAVCEEPHIMDGEEV